MGLNGGASVRNISCFIVLYGAVFVFVAPGDAQSIDETYKLALKEDGALNIYGTLTPDTAVKVLPVFEKRFPGIKTVNTGASSDKIVARAISEACGGRTIGDVFHMNLENVMQVHEQGQCWKSFRRKPTFLRVISKVLTGLRPVSIPGGCLEHAVGPQSRRAEKFRGVRRAEVEGQAFGRAA